MSFKNVHSFFFHFKLWYSSLARSRRLLGRSSCLSRLILSPSYLSLRNVVCILVGEEEDVYGGKLETGEQEGWDLRAELEYGNKFNNEKTTTTHFVGEQER